MEENTIHEYDLRPWYVRVCKLSGKVENEYRYDDLMLNPMLRKALGPRSSPACKISCCCRRDDLAVVSFDCDGKLIHTDLSLHEPECAEHIQTLEKVFEGTFVRSFSLLDCPLPLLFSMKPDVKQSPSVINTKSCEVIFPYGDSAAMEQLLSALNMKVFRGSRKNFLSLRKDTKLQTEEFMDALEDLYISEKGGPARRITAAELYSEALTPVDGYGLLYGKIEWLNREQIPEADHEGIKYYSTAWLILRDHYGKKITLTVKRKEFRDRYYRLPDRENAWIFAKVVHKRQTRTDPTFFRKGVPVITKVKPVHVKTHADLMDVSVCRQYVLFSCNDCGMIVFSQKEQRISNQMITEGKRLERSFGLFPNRVPCILNIQNPEERISP